MCPLIYYYKEDYMASKVKKYNHYIVLQRGKTKKWGCTTLGRYIVAAKNEKEAVQFVKNKFGKHINVSVYYKIPDWDVESYVQTRHERKKLDYKEVIKE